MRQLLLLAKPLYLVAICSVLASCTTLPSGNGNGPMMTSSNSADYESRLPAYVDTGGKKMVLVDPKVHAWGAYGADGHIVRAGIATAGGAVCPPDADEPDCRTSVGTFHITSTAGERCYSKTFPRPNGGGLMPFCMYFHNGMALHGSPDDIVVEDNVSHGCVRMRIPDAEWMYNNFAKVGTTVRVLPYDS